MMEALESEFEVNTKRQKIGQSLEDRCRYTEEKYKNHITKRKKKYNKKKAVSVVSKDQFSTVKNIEIPDTDKLSKPENVIPKDIKNPEKGLPSLFKCAEMLKERVHLINHMSSLYYFNGRCYDLINSDDIIALYREKVDNKLGGEKSLNSITQLHRFLCTDSEITVKGIDNNKRIVVLRNGIYDVEKKELRPHSYNEIVFSYIDADYVEHGNCRHFENFLHDVTEGDPILQERLWKFLAYVLMQTTEAKVFFVMGEAPDSGKSLFGNFIESLYPEKYVSNVALTDFNRSFSIAPIAGSAINISLDLPASRLNAVAVSKLKMLTGGDAFNINQKYVPEYRYENRAKLVFASNFPISLTEEDDAFWNRLVYLPFNKSIPKEKQNTALSKKIKKEKNAIVSRALHYANELVSSGFYFPTTPQIERKMQEWQGKKCSTIENYIKECCLCSPEYKGELVDKLYTGYEQYCNTVGLVPQNRYHFKKFLEEQVGLKHFKMRDGGINPRSAFKGILLNDNIG